ncbi:MAG: NosD domain-containing protein [Candidatus Bathyarchaeia archaeon]
MKKALEGSPSLLSIFVLMLLAISVALPIWHSISLKKAYGSWIGTVYIRADGTIDPPDAPIVTYKNITYILVDNIVSNADGIIVERSNITFEGLGYTVHGLGTPKSKGILLSNVGNVTVKNINVEGFYVGIFLNRSFSCKLLGSGCIRNNTNGVALLYSSHNLISGINITRNEHGVGLWGSWNNTISGNVIAEHVEWWMPCGIYLQDSAFNIISQNKLRGNKEGIYFYNSSNNAILKNEITHSHSNVIRFFESSNNIIAENQLTNNGEGILFYYSSNNNSVVLNNITDNTYGILISDSSHYNDISKNIIKANEQSGIEVNRSSNSTLIGNLLEDNENGIYLLGSHGNTISRNIIKENVNCGIHFEASACNMVSENRIENNGNGTWFAMSSQNKIYHNNFINNTRQVYDLSWDELVISPSINIWDDGYPSGGNFWSDYTGVDLYSGPYQNTTGSDGISDVPYNIDDNNVDRYPLMAPWAVGPSIVKIRIDKENVKTLKIEVFNPEYSPLDAVITRIRVGFKGGEEIYEAVETEPPIENGILIPRGESVNITCGRFRKDEVHFSWGEIASKFPGETIIVHVFFQEFPTVSKEAKLPYVKLYITPEFNAKVSFRRFNITITNDPWSEVNLTIRDILVAGIDIVDMDPDIRAVPVSLQPNNSIYFRFNGSWHGVVKTVIYVDTEQGYIFRETVELEVAFALIQSVDFYEEHPDYFNVTIRNFPESDVYINVTKITCKLANGTIIERYYPSVGIMPNSTMTFRFDLDWTSHMGEIIELQAYFLQDFETLAYSVEVIPEFPHVTLLSLLILTTLIAIILKHMGSERPK